MGAFNRVSSLAASALFCAFVAGFVALYAHVESLPPSDGAYGISVWEALGLVDVLVVWLLVVCVGAGIGFAFSLWALWKVNLVKAIPVVAAVTVVAAAASAPLLSVLSSLVALVAGILAMLWCRAWPGWESNTPMQTDRTAAGR